MIETDPQFRRDFVRDNTVLRRPAIVPELLLRLAGPPAPIWKLSETQLAELGLPPPYWCWAWAGGQGLARYLIDHPHAAAGQRVLDFASGCGVAAIAAAKAGAAEVVAADIDPFSEAAVGLNAEANAVRLKFTGENLLDGAPPPADLILAGDVWYRGPLADQLRAWLAAARTAGARVLLGDPGRPFFPQDGVTALAAYDVPTIAELEGAAVMRATVWELT